MKQTLEEAAYDYATNKTKFRKEVLKEVDLDNYVSRKSDCMEDFQCGAEWHAKQSLWISVKEWCRKRMGITLLLTVMSLRKFISLKDGISLYQLGIILIYFTMKAK